ncbi:long-chain-fatty-acid-CoA ligase-like protein [Coleophoma crateriformis]|uniref:Long-chain-fatty-acid-CoA ligase-like protein n=1 Tax=Coleophoma crateriformis TaxID=565419 RepID=A0A3D8QDY9_9HELO|nr:long-chain-fatty-acid-CoA ligase-like protein [Coleophoma crateriformis]
MAAEKPVLLPRMTRSPPFTVEVPGAVKVEGETIPRRNARSPNALRSTPEAGVNTVFDILTRSAKKFGDSQAVGWRKLIKKHEEVKKVKKMVDGVVTDVDKKWLFFEMSGYHFLTFVEYERLALQLGCGFRKLGLVKEDRVHIYATTSAYWLAVAHGAVSQSMPIVTAYDTLGEEGLRHSLVATKAKAIFVEPHLLKTLSISLQTAKDIQYVIYNDITPEEVNQNEITKLKTAHPNLIILSFEDLRKLGEDNMVDSVPPSSEDVCCIMYTSGSTGTPKGVPLKHKNVVAAVAGVDTVLGDSLGPEDTLLTYLPLAHIFEFVVEHLFLYMGSTMGYGTIRTLSATSMKNCKGDIQELRPTLLVGVPAVWETVKKGIMTQITKSSALVQKLFWGALYSKTFLMSRRLPGSGLLDAIVFNKVREATGGRLRLTMNGGSPIAKETQDFISMAIAPMINGYGSTETTAMGALCDPLAWTSSAHGDIESCLEIKFVDFADAGYFATNNPPQGEIWIRGYCVLEKYYENEEETAAALTPDGWFKTGDIGEWDKNGHLKIIDRKKNLVKTLNGEYIALEKLESVYRSASVVGNICVYASITESKPIAIIFPVEAALKALAEEVGVQGHGLGDLVHNEKVQKAVLKQLQTVGSRVKLAAMEIIEGVVLSDEEWTPQNGLVTAVGKLNRKGLFEKYKKEIDKAYKKG